jgi:hypothetical protein
MLPVTTVALAPTPSVPALEPAEERVSCAFIVRGTGSLVDCDEERDVAMEFLMVAESDPGDCRSGRASCGQSFIVRCDDYWSEQHETEYAIVKYDAGRLEDRLTAEQLPGSGQARRLRIHRDHLCDDTPFESGFWSDCVSWDCAPDCCRFYSPFKRLEDGSDVLLQDLERFGGLPCLRLVMVPLPTVERP